jgi:hypothetical protein
MVKLPRFDPRVSIIISDSTADKAQQLVHDG